MNIDFNFLDQISAKHGSSFYLLDSERFRDNFNRLSKCFRIYYPDTTVAYSYKTNYVPRYCQIVDSMGGFAEVVSSMEMMLALKIGVSASKIFFNGPYKEQKYVEQLLNAGGTVNVDSMEELKRIAASVSDFRREPLKLGLRCNFDVQDGVLSRFGFDVNNSVFSEAIALIDAHPNIKLVGLHCHFATRSLDCWRNRTLGMISVIERYFKDRLHDLRHVSLGGGMYGYMPPELSAQFPVEIPSFEDYALAAAKAFAEYFDAQETNHRPVLIIEPGTALVADAMKYVCQVNSIKRMQNRTIVSLTGSTYNINPNPNRKNVPIKCFSNNLATDRQELVDAYFGGYTCIEGDYLYKGFNGLLSVGDYVVFEDVGSYSVVMKPPFILPNVAILEPMPGELQYKVIKRPEHFDDIFATYTFQ